MFRVVACVLDTPTVKLTLYPKVSENPVAGVVTVTSCALADPVDVDRRKANVLACVGVNGVESAPNDVMSLFAPDAAHVVCMPFTMALKSAITCVASATVLFSRMNGSAPGVHSACAGVASKSKNRARIFFTRQPSRSYIQFSGSAGINHQS